MRRGGGQLALIGTHVDPPGLIDVGMKEVFFLTIAIFLDLGDIIGYSLVPNRRKRVEEDEPFDDEALLTRLTPMDPERRLAARTQLSLLRDGSEVEAARFILPLPSSSQSSDTLSFTASVIRKSACGVVPFS